MDLHHYWLFICASIVLCIVPGPDMIYLLSRSIAQGKKSEVAAAIGFNLGGYVHLTAAILGISAVIATSSMAFTVLKLSGAAYLFFYIGLTALINTRPLFKSAAVTTPETLKTICWQGFISDLFNPKVALFFISLLPQFITPESGSINTQLFILGITVNMIALIINLIIIIFADKATRQLRDNKQISAILNKIMGGVFIALSIKLANDKP